MNDELTKTEARPLKTKRLNKKQRLFLEYWIQPESETFANGYRSALKAGFAPKYALNITGQNPKWLSESIDKLELHPEHIKQGISKIATGEINSKSVDDTRLKAYELLARYSGMDKDKQVNITVVQPILGGASVHKDSTVYRTHAPNTTIIDQEPEKSAQ